MLVYFWVDGTLRTDCLACLPVDMSNGRQVEAIFTRLHFVKKQSKSCQLFE